MIVYTETLSGVKGKKEATICLKHSIVSKLLLVKSIMKDSMGRSSETAKPNERMLYVTSSVWNQEIIM